MSQTADRLFKALLFAIVLFFLRQTFAQNPLIASDVSRTQMGRRALLESRPGQSEYPRVLSLKAMARVSKLAEKRVQSRIAIQTTSETARLVRTARPALSSLKDLSLSVGQLYRGKAYIPPGLNYFSLSRGRVTDVQFRNYLQRTKRSAQQVLDIVEVSISFENMSDLYLALEGLLRADSRKFIQVVGFRDHALKPFKDGDRQVEVFIRSEGHVSTLRLEIQPYLMARAHLKGDKRLLIRQRIFKSAQEMAEKNYAKRRAQVIRYNSKVGPLVLNQLEAMNRSLRTMEAARTAAEPLPTSSVRPANSPLNTNPDGVLCSNWNQVSVNNGMSSADKLRTFIWGLTQPPCHGDRIRAGHLLYKQIFDSYVGFEYNKDPQQRVQQALLRSVYLATADYLRARPTAAQGQMCRPEEKIRIYRGVGAMPLYRQVGAPTGVHLAPLFGDQLTLGLKEKGLIDADNMPMVPNRDLGELSFQGAGSMAHLTWDFIEGVPHGWKFVLGLQRTNHWTDKNKDGIPEEEPVDPGVPFPHGPLPPFSPEPFPIAESVTGSVFSSATVNKPMNEEPVNPGGIIPLVDEDFDSTDKWNEPGKSWYKLNGQLQRVLAWHTSTSTYSPFLSASFSEDMGRGYGPLMIVMDVCPERILPNFEPSGGFASEEEVYIPFFVLPEEIVRIEGRQCWLARSRPGVNLMTPEEQEKHFEQSEKICAESYNKKPGDVIESVNKNTEKWRSFFRNFRVKMLTVDNEFFELHDPQHLRNSQDSFYGLLAQGLSPSSLNPSGEMTLARWRDIARHQVRGFQSCQSSKSMIERFKVSIEDYKKQISDLLEQIKKNPDPNAGVTPWPDPMPVPIPLPMPGGVIVEPMPATEMVGPSVNNALEEPVPPPVLDWRLESIKSMEKEIQAYEKRILDEKKLASSRCGQL